MPELITLAVIIRINAQEGLQPTIMSMIVLVSMAEGVLVLLKTIKPQHIRPPGKKMPDPSRLFLEPIIL